MPRQKVRDNNWSALGRLIIDVWAKSKGPNKRAVIEDLRDAETVRATLERYGVEVDKRIKTIVVHEDSKDTLHVVIPSNPWTKDELSRVGEMDTYLRELGIIVMGGCK